MLYYFKRSRIKCIKLKCTLAKISSYQLEVFLFVLYNKTSKIHSPGLIVLDGTGRLSLSFTTCLNKLCCDIVFLIILCKICFLFKIQNIQRQRESEYILYKTKQIRSSINYIIFDKDQYCVISIVC